MDELHQLHEAITKLWNLIKKYHGKLTTDEMFEMLYEEAEKFTVDDPKITDLLRDWISKWMMYEEKK